MIRTKPSDPFHLTRLSVIRQILYRQIVRIRAIPSARRYDLTISYQSRFIWFRVPKVASRTILNHLRSQGVSLDAEHPYSVGYLPSMVRDYFKFGFVRNPWDRLVSYWLNRVRTQKNDFQLLPEQLHDLQQFPAFVDFVGRLDLESCNQHVRLQTALIDLNEVDYLGRMEQFDTDFREVCGRLNIPPAGPAARSNVTRNRMPYQAYYDERLRRSVAEFYEKDIRMFGYSFEEP